MKKKISQRNTKQRKVILEELQKVKTHPTADSVFKMVRRKIPAISFGTVYRNLNLLKDEGRILELTQGKYGCRYDGNPKIHYHLFCLSCEGVFDSKQEVLKDLNRKARRASGFLVKYHRINFYGYCRECKDKNKAQRQRIQRFAKAAS